MNILFKLTTLSLLVSSSAMAQEETTAPTVVVTATRFADSPSDTLAATTVIKRDAINRMQATSIMDVLQAVPGITLTNQGGLGKTTSIHIRGTNSGHALVLVDGVTIGSATLGSVAIQDIPVDQIDRIEVVRGPQSSLYGSEAIGGVIQIFTRKGTRTEPHFSLGAGSQNTLRMTTGFSVGDSRSWFNLDVSALNSKGINATKGNEPDADGYRNTSTTLRAGHRFNNGAELNLHGLQAQGRNEFDGSWQNENTFVQQAIGANLRLPVTRLWLAELSLGTSADKSNNYLNGAFKSNFETRRNKVSLLNNFILTTEQMIGIGIDYQDDRVDSNTAYTVSSRHNTGLFAQYQASLGAHDLQASLRQDDNQQFGQHNTGSLNYGYGITERLRLVASHGTAFKAPSFNDLYSPWGGNATLRPEQSTSSELGLTGKYATGHWAVRGYHTEIKDLIPWIETSPGIWEAKNITARINGIEASSSVNLAHWQINAAVNLLDPRDATNDKLLPRRARETATVSADRSFGNLKAGLSVHGESARYDDAANTTSLGGFTTVDLRAEYAIAPHWIAGGRLANLFDKEYTTAYNYHQPGRNVFFTLRYVPAAK